MKWEDNELRRYHNQRRAMFNSISRKCSCGKQASFNYPALKIAQYCKTCKLSGMVNVRRKK